MISEGNLTAVTNAVFTFSESSSYDDLPEERYHFPQTYLNQVLESRGDWIVYYEPRRTEGPHSSTGRQAYFAMARVRDVVPDQKQIGYHFAYLSDYVEFDNPVPFRDGAFYYESGLVKDDGSTNKGAFGRSVRLIGRSEFESISEAGFARQLQPWERMDRVEAPAPDIVERPTVVQVVTRKFRDEAFRRHVREAYANTCAVTGLSLINGGGRPEVQAAHIRPVDQNGPDAVRNGIALTATVHWMFDRGLISFDDSHRVLVAARSVPAELAGLVRAGNPIRVPDDRELQPHPAFLRWHRENRFKG